MMNKTEKEIMITDVFSDGSTYCIPLYQRDYAWGFDEVQQLILDIESISENTDKYYIGTLVVYKREDGSYEVIDGQQRLTTLFLLFSQLPDKNNYFGENTSLCFDCREKSNECLEALLKTDNEKLQDENAITENAKVIKRLLKNRDGFENCLKKVAIFRVEVPRNTDLNHYFEIMNTRGEQLEHTDIIKSRLMNPLDPKQHAVFAEMWDACSDMGHYIQIGVTTSREKLFGQGWNSLPRDCFSIINDKKGESNKKTITEAIVAASKNKFFSKPEFDENHQSVDKGYNSIISFPYFLLHAFRIYAKVKKSDDSLSSTLNDRLLIKDFETVFGKKCSKKDAEDFINFLVRLRYLFDKYIVKRYCVSTPTDGVWTVRSYVKNLDKNKPGYKSTFASSGSEVDDSDAGKKCVMLQSCLRVSFTSPRIMHWITHALEWLYLKNDAVDCSQFNSFLTDYIINGNEKDDSVTIRKFLNEKQFAQGTDTPNLVFNFLDYCIWNSDEFKIDKKDRFRFEFRNSVEHYYPQTPSPLDGLDYWDEVDIFGNLALLQRQINSHFSNLPPTNKRKYIEDYLSKGEKSMSLKLQLMAQLTTDNDSWKYISKQHGDDMIRLLEEVCKLYPESKQ